MKNRFDLEQDIMSCWNITEDIKVVTEHFADSPTWAHMPPDVADAILNKFLGIKELYEVRFENLWNTFEALIPTMDQQGTSTDISTNYTDDVFLSWNNPTWDNVTYTVNGNIGDTSAMTFTLTDRDHDYNEQK